MYSGTLLNTHQILLPVRCFVIVQQNLCYFVLQVTFSRDIKNDRSHLKDWNAFMFRTCRYTNRTLVPRGGQQTAIWIAGLLSETYPSVSRNSFSLLSTWWRLSTSFGGKYFPQVNGNIFQTPTSFQNSLASFLSTLVRPTFRDNTMFNDSRFTDNAKRHRLWRIAPCPCPITWSRAH